MEAEKTKTKKPKMKGDAEPLPMATGSGEIVKMEVDYSDTCDKAIPEAEALAKGGNLNKALEQLIVLEKQTRTGGDMISTGRVLVCVVQLCHAAQNWTRMKEEIVNLTRRRGQLKQAVVKMVQEVCTYIDQLPTTELKYEMVNTLRDVTEGKIYVEVERARLTHRLSKMKEAEGKIVEAANILQELQVETYGSMEKREKVELILEQMRYCLAKKDYIRTQIISKKINTKYFDDEGTQDLKLKYYELMIEMDQHDGSYLSICRHVRAMITTSSIEADLAKKKQLLRTAGLYVVLSPYDNEQFELLHRMLDEKVLDPIYKRFLGLFKNQEIIDWKELCGEYEKELKTSPPKQAQVDANGVPGADTYLSIVYGVFDTSELGLKRWQNLKDRVVEHNIRIMAKYYTRVSLKRMAHLLDLNEKEVEDVLCSMVVAGTVQGKIDRPSGIVSFQPTKDPSELLNDWSHNVNTLMTLIARTTHLINKEEMVHTCLFKDKKPGAPGLGAGAGFLISEAPSEESMPMETETES